MLGKQDALEAALWAAIVALDERAEISRRIAKRLEENGRLGQLGRYRADTRAAAERADALRELTRDLVQGVNVSYDEGDIGNSAD